MTDASPIRITLTMPSALYLTNAIGGMANNILQSTYKVIWNRAPVIRPMEFELGLFDMTGITDDAERCQLISISPI